MGTPVLSVDVCIADAAGLRDMAAYLDSMGKKESGKFLRSVADRHEVLAGAYQTSITRYERELKEWIERDRLPEEKSAAIKWLADLHDSVTTNA